MRRYLQELEGLRLLQVRRRGLGKTNVYVLTRWTPARPAKLADQERPKSSVLERPQWPGKKEKQEERKEHHQADDAVAALQQFGVTPATARRLVAAVAQAGKPPAYINEKLAHVRFLVETNSPLVSKNPRGYLIRAIQDDYPAPPGYRSPTETQAQRAAKTQREAEAERLLRAEEERHERQRAAERQQVLRMLSAVRAAHPPAAILGTDLTTETAWKMALQRLRRVLEPADYTAWLSDALLVSWDGSTGVVAAQNAFAASWIAKRFSSILEQELAAVLGFPVQLQYIAITELMGKHDAGDTPRSADQLVSSHQPSDSVHVP